MADDLERAARARLERELRARLLARALGLTAPAPLVRQQQEGRALEESAESLAHAAHDAMLHGDTAKAMTLGGLALERLAALPETDQHRRGQAALLADMAHFKWEDTAPGSLQEALRLARRAQEFLRPGDPPQLVASVLATTGWICHDVGDVAALEEGLAALATAIRLLEASGDPLGAARLLNDQAALHARRGELPQAAQLLRASRTIFENQEDEAFELAETDHLLARLAFHAHVPPEHAEEVLATALEHAAKAEEIYREEGLPRELGRILETQGRLHARAGNLREAVQFLTEASQMQQAVGDLLGLAATSSALAETLARAGRFDAAIQAIADSIGLNARIGSAKGLEYNREALDALAPSVPGPLRPLLVAVAAQLEQAEQTVLQA